MCELGGGCGALDGGKLCSLSFLMSSLNKSFWDVEYYRSFTTVIPGNAFIETQQAF